MEHLPTWIALIALLPAVAFYEQRQHRARPWLSWLSLLAAGALAVAAIAYFPVAVWKAVTIFLLFGVWSIAVVLVLAGLERIPSLVGGAVRGRSSGSRREQPRRVVARADASRV